MSFSTFFRKAFELFQHIVQDGAVEDHLVSYTLKQYEPSAMPDLKDEREYEELVHGFRNYLELLILQDKKHVMIVERAQNSAPRFVHFTPTLGGAFLKQTTETLVL